MINPWRACALMSMLVLAACGGGGGGGGGGSGNDWLTFSPTPLNVSAVDHLSQTFQVSAHSSRVISQQLYVKIVDSSGVIDGNVQIDPSAEDSQTIVTTLETSPTLQAGSYKGSFAVWLYTDAAMTQVYDGSPWNVPYDIEVAPRHADHRIFADRQAVALAAFPTTGKSRLTGSIRLQDNQGLSTPWAASSDQSWLTVTASGKVGDGTPLTVSADPASLPVDSLSIATITITSGGTSIAAPEIVRVGVWKSSTDPTSHVTAVPYAALVADPLRPYVYGLSPNVGGQNNAMIDVVNVYTGAVVARIAPDQHDGVGSQVSAMAVSGDGKRLYVGENAVQVGIYDLETQTFSRTVAANVRYGSLDFERFGVLRVDGHELLVTNDGDVVDLDTGRSVASLISTFPSHPIMHWDAYRSQLYAVDSGASPGLTKSWSVDWIDRDGGSALFTALQTRALPAMYWEGGGLSPDGSVLYAGNGSFDAQTLAATSGAVPRTDPVGGGMLYQIRVGPDGRRYVYYVTGSLYVYAADGTQLVREDVPPNEDLLPAAVSSDGVVVALIHDVGVTPTVELRAF